MKMLTIHNLGAPKPDFCWGVEGELAIAMLLPCDRRDCGCDRIMVGLNSHRATTTVMVRDVDLTIPDFVTACVGFLADSGWTKLMGDDLAEEAKWLMASSASVAEQFPAGTVLRPRFDRSADEWVYTEVVGESR
jgi:hypothetical protein